MPSTIQESQVEYVDRPSRCGLTRLNPNSRAHWELCLIFSKWYVRMLDPPSIFNINDLMSLPYFSSLLPIQMFNTFQEIELIRMNKWFMIMWLYAFMRYCAVLELITALLPVGVYSYVVNWLLRTFVAYWYPSSIEGVRILWQNPEAWSDKRCYDAAVRSDSAMSNLDPNSSTRHINGHMSSLGCQTYKIRTAC